MAIAISARTGRDRRPVILHVLHGGGGLEVSVRLLMQQHGTAFRHCTLSVRSSRDWAYEMPDGGETRLTFAWWDGLGRVVRRLGVDLVHVHHLAGDRQRLLRALARLSVPYGVTVHDFYLVCPRTHLVPPGGVY